MPFYTVYHPTELLPLQRAEIANAITQAHCNATGAPHFLVRVTFIATGSTSYFSGGIAETSFLRIVGVIRSGRSKECKQALLRALYNGIKQQGCPHSIEIHLEEVENEVLHSETVSYL
jgi:phenylpyruvate tautomerase PptA (4-oxalocrotonate tautomerase family)